MSYNPVSLNSVAFRLKTKSTRTHIYIHVTTYKFTDFQIINNSLSIKLPMTARAKGILQPLTLSRRFVPSHNDKSCSANPFSGHRPSHDALFKCRIYLRFKQYINDRSACYAISIHTYFPYTIGSRAETIINTRDGTRGCDVYKQ